MILEKIKWFFTRVFLNKVHIYSSDTAILECYYSIHANSLLLFVINQQPICNQLIKLNHFFKDIPQGKKKLLITEETVLNHNTIFCSKLRKCRRSLMIHTWIQEEKSFLGPIVIQNFPSFSEITCSKYDSFQHTQPSKQKLLKCSRWSEELQ